MIAIIIRPRRLPALPAAPCITVSSNRRGGSALVPVMLFVVVVFFVLGSVLLWTKNTGRLVQHQYEFSRAQYVAEAGAEKVFSSMRTLLDKTGVPPTQSILDGIATSQLPTSDDHPTFGDYQFLTSDGTAGKIDAALLGSATTRTLSAGPYSGLVALVTPYRIVSRVTAINRPTPVKAGIQRTVEVQSIPVFQFAVFWDGDMDMSCGQPMTVTGRVHANGDGYFVPGQPQIFVGDVTLVGNMYNHAKAGDTTHPSPGAPTFSGTLTENAPRLSMPLGGNNPRDILDPPPTTGTDPISAQRLYNKAGLRISVTDGGVTATDQSGTSVTLPAGILVITNSLYNFREKKTVSITDLDINKMIASSASPANGIVYLQDTRAKPGTAIRVINGDSLPASGLTVVTPNPLYVKGNFNSATKAPAALFCDAINVLSSNWQDSKSSLALGTRTATDTSIYGAFFAGNVPTSVATDYSGGLENFPRFLENWSPATFTYVGSMVCMFPSKYATGRYLDSNYNPPKRVWSFDTQFLDPARVPRGTPAVNTILQTTWASVE